MPSIAVMTVSDGRESVHSEVGPFGHEVQRRLAEAPAAVVVANHCIGLLQLAALHLDQDEPKLADAQLAIDALAAVVESLGSRLEDNEQPLREALAQIRLAYVQVKTARGSG